MRTKFFVLFVVLALVFANTGLPVSAQTAKEPTWEPKPVVMVVGSDVKVATNIGLSDGATASSGMIFQEVGKSPDGKFEVGRLFNANGEYTGNYGWINLDNAKLTAPATVPDLKVTAVCEVEKYTPKKATVRWGTRWVYDALQPCLVVFDGQIAIGGNIHNLVELTDGAGNVVPGLTTHAMFVANMGTFAHYPSGNVFDQPEFGSDNTWNLIEGWARDIRERLDKRTNPNKWILHITFMNGNSVDRKKGEYDATAPAGSKNYRTCDGMTGPEDLPINPSDQNKANGLKVAAIGSQKCLTLFVGKLVKPKDGQPDQVVVLVATDIVDPFSYYEGTTTLFPAEATQAVVADYVRKVVAQLYPPSTTLVNRNIDNLEQTLPGTKSS